MYAMIWVASGLVIGALARFFVRGRGFGRGADLTLGLLGSVAGGWMFHLLGVTGRGANASHATVALLGATVLVGASRLVRPAAQGTQRRLAEAAPAADLDARVRQLRDRERAALDALLRRARTVRDPNAAFDQQLTRGQRVADKVASFGGSWNFIGLFLLFMLGWLVLNTEAVRFDPFPFILLNLILSCLAALQAPVIMMSQNRHAAKDRIDAQHDYEVNLRAELEIQSLHAKIDNQQETAWVELLDLQRRQILLLEDLAGRSGAR